MWIQEGITTYSEALAFREMGGERAYDSLIQRFKMNIRNIKPLVQGAEVNSADTYTGDVYTKGAFFMHTLRYVIGDTIFFPTLKRLATDSLYTYHNFVTSDDVEKLFSSQSGMDLKPLFDFYLRTTKKIDFIIKQTGIGEYVIETRELPMPLPVEIITDSGLQRMIITQKPLKLKTGLPPVIDASGHYFKRVTWE